MACLEFNDGTKVYLSDETTNRLRKELIKDDGQLKVDRFRARKLVGHSYIRIAFMGYPGDVWDGCCNGNAKVTDFFVYSEIRKIANGLLKMIGG